MSAWILLRGWTREAAHWGAFPAILADTLEAQEVVALDLPGTGALVSRASPWTVQAIMERCRDVLAIRGAPHPVNLLGLSLGAMTAIAWCDVHPRDVGRCVLVNPSARPFSPFYRRLRPATYPAILRALLASDPRRREAAVLALTSASRGVAALDTWIGIANERPVSRANALRQLVAAARFRCPPVARVPTLVLASGADRLVDPECSRALARRWGVPCEVHPSAGHDLPLDDGAWLAQRVRDWLKRS